MSLSCDEASDRKVFDTPLGYWLVGLAHALLLTLILGIILPSGIGLVLVLIGSIASTPAYVAWACLMLFGLCMCAYFFRYRLVRRVVLEKHGVVFHACWRSIHVPYDEAQLIRIVEDERLRKGYARVVVEVKWGEMHQIVLQEHMAMECFHLLLELCPSAAAIDIDESYVIPDDGIDRMAAERRLAGFFARRARAFFAACVLGIPTTIFFIYFAVTNRSFSYTNLRVMSLVIVAPVLTIAAGMYGLASMRKAKRLQAHNVKLGDDRESDR